MYNIVILEFSKNLQIVLHNFCSGEKFDKIIIFWWKLLH